MMGLECYCGLEQPPSYLRVNDGACNQPCTVDPTKMCGGMVEGDPSPENFRMNVYQVSVANDNTSESVLTLGTSL